MDPKKFQELIAKYSQPAKPKRPDEPEIVEPVELEKPATFDQPLGKTEQVGEAELKYIADKYGIDEEDKSMLLDKLKTSVPYFGASVAEDTDKKQLTKMASQLIGEGLLMGVPQKIYTQTQKPRVQKALDELRELADRRKGLATKAAEIATGVATPALGIASKAAKALGTGVAGEAAIAGAGAGAAAGYGQSKRGQAVKDTATGAALGGALGGAAGKVIDTLAGVTKSGKISGNKADNIDLDNLIDKSTDRDLAEAEKRLLSGSLNDADIKLLAGADNTKPRKKAKVKPEIDYKKILSSKTPPEVTITDKTQPVIIEPVNKELINKYIERPKQPDIQPPLKDDTELPLVDELKAAEMGIEDALSKGITPEIRAKIDAIKKLRPEQKQDIVKQVEDIELEETGTPVTNEKLLAILSQDKPNIKSQEPIKTSRQVIKEETDLEADEEIGMIPMPKASKSIKQILKEDKASQQYYKPPVDEQVKSFNYQQTIGEAPISQESVDFSKAVPVIYNNPKEPKDIILAANDDMFFRFGNLTEQKPLADNVYSSLPTDLQAKRLETRKKTLDKQFSQFMNGRSADEVIAEEGKAAFDYYFDRFNKVRAAQDAIIKNNLKGQPEPSGFLKLIYNYSDARPILEIFDRKFGSSMGKSIDDVSSGLNRLSYELSSEFTNLPKELKDVTGDSSIAIIKEMEQNTDPEDLVSAEATKLKEWFEAQRQKANIKYKENGVPREIKQRPNYVPMLPKSAPEIAALLKKDIQDYDFQMLSGDEIKNLLSKDSAGPDADAARFIMSLASDDAKVPLETRFYESMNQILGGSKAFQQRLNNRAFTTYARGEGTIPDRYRDMDLGSVMKRWLTSTYKDIYLTKALDELRDYQKIIAETGDDYTAGYIGDLVQDVMGPRIGTVASNLFEGQLRLQAKLLAKAEQSTNETTKETYRLLSQYPQLANSLVNNLYSNWLGMSPKATIQNAISPLLQAVPELGPVYGTKLYLKSMADVADLIKQGGADGVNKFIKDNGLLPEHYAGETIQSELSTGKGLSNFIKASDAINKIGMYTFTVAEKAARAQTAKMAENLAADLFAKKPEAMKFVSNIPDFGYRSLLIKALDKGDEKLATDQLKKYFNARYLFNYDKANMSRYGRELGPLFSMLQKWPTTYVGKLANMADLVKRGHKPQTIQLAQALMGPYLILSLIDSLRDQKSAVQTQVIGKKGAAEWAGIAGVPILGETLYKGQSYLRDKLGGEPLPPAFVGGKEGLINSAALSNVNKVIESLGSEKAVSKATQEVVMSHLPSAWVLRFLFDDLPVYLENKEKDTKTPILERMLKQADKLSK